MSRKIDNRFVIPGLFFALLLSFASSSASAEELVMGTIPSDVPGTNEILDGDYKAGIQLSERYVNAGHNLRKLAARTNLCVAYTALKQYDDAAKWCDSAMEVERRAWVTKNNRAVLAYMVGDYTASQQLLSEAREAGGGKLSAMSRNFHVVEIAVARLDKEQKFEPVASVS